MNVGIVTTWFERGAAYVSRQYRRALETHHQVFIYARGGETQAKGDQVWDDSRVTWAAQGVVPAPMSMDLDDFARWVREKRLDVVFFNEQHWWEPVLLALGMPGVRTGAYVDYYTHQTVPLFGCYDFLVCNTRRHFGVFEKHPQAFYIPWGADLGLFKPASFDPVTAGSVTFFHSAGMSPPRKGTDLVLRAFSRLEGSARLVIHTQIDVGSCFPELQPAISQLRDRGVMEMRCETVPAPGLYHLGDVLVYPSRLDGIGLTIAEALACGLPVIVSDNPPMNEFVDTGSGRAARVKSFAPRNDSYYWPMCEVDEDDLVLQMQTYVDAAPELTRLKRAAREHAESHLDWSRNAQRLPGIFERVRRIAAEEKAEAIEKAREFERNRSEDLATFLAVLQFSQVG